MRAAEPSAAEPSAGRPAVGRSVPVGMWVASDQAEVGFAAGGAVIGTDRMLPDGPSSVVGVRAPGPAMLLGAPAGL